LNTFASKWLGSRGLRGAGSALPRLLARESTSWLREERRIGGGKELPQAWKIGL